MERWANNQVALSSAGEGRGAAAAAAAADSAAAQSGMELSHTSTQRLVYHKQCD